MNNNAYWDIDFGYAGTCTAFHHQYFQMIDLMMLHCKREMNGLNPHALLHEPTVKNTSVMEETTKGRK